MNKGIIIIIFVSLLLIGIVEAAEGPGAPPGPPASITLTASSPDVRADGIYTTIIATLNDSKGNPSPGADVYFNTTLGSINTTYGYFGGFGWLNVTDNNGMTMAVLNRSTNESVTVTVSSRTIIATITISDQPTTTTITANPTPVETIPPVSTAITPVPTTPGAITTGATTTPITTAQTPAVTTPAAATVTSTPVTTTTRAPGFGIVFSILIIIILSTKTFRRK
jgi:hypothetical protein